MNTALKKIPLIRLWLPYLVLSVGLTMFAQVALQQSYRQNANDPQIQMAEDTATALEQGKKPADLVPAITVDLRRSLAPALIITDENLNVIASSARLDGRTPLPPHGAFEAALNGQGKDTAEPGENRITWQPASDVRQAAVIVHYKGGYVVASRSLREVEAHEGQLTQMAALTFIGLLVASLLLLLIVK